MDLRRILAATDHTQLSPTATAADIARLCAEAARHGSVLEIRLLPVSGKNPLENSAVYRDLRSAGGK